MTTPIDPAQLVTAIIALITVAGITGTVAYKRGRQGLHDVRDILDNADDAAQSGTLTHGQATSIINDVADIAGSVLNIHTINPPTVATAPSGTNTTTSPQTKQS